MRSEGNDRRRVRILWTAGLLAVVVVLIYGMFVFRAIVGAPS